MRQPVFAFVIAAGLCVAAAQVGVAQQAAAPQPPATAGDQEMQLTPEQAKEYYATYKRPEVKYLRTVLNASLKGEQRPDAGFDQLKSVDSAYFRSKFIVITIVTPSGGGSLMTLMFQDRPDTLFKALVWKDSKNPSRLELRQFEKAEVGPESVTALQRKYKRLLADKTHAM